MQASSKQRKQHPSKAAEQKHRTQNMPPKISEHPRCRGKAHESDGRADEMCIFFNASCPSVKSENQKTPSSPWRRPTQLLPQAQGESSTSNSPPTPSPPSNPTASSYWTLKPANALQQLTSQLSPPMSATNYVKWGNPSECSGRIWQLFEIGCG